MLSTLRNSGNRGTGNASKLRLLCLNIDGLDNKTRKATSAPCVAETRRETRGNSRTFSGKGTKRQSGSKRKNSEIRQNRAAMVTY